MNPNSNHRVNHQGLPRTGKFAAALATLALVGAFGAGSSIAAASGSSPTCTPASATSQPFRMWSDNSSYFLAPGGSFESQQSLQGWSMSGSVKIVSGNESYNVHSYGDSHSLAIGSGASTTSPQICVTIHSPNLRFFLRNTGSSWGRMNVSMNYTNKYGAARTAQLGSFSAGAGWALSPQVMFLNGIAPVVGAQGQTSVSFTFTPTAGNWQIDDFYVDPLKSQ